MGVTIFRFFKSTRSGCAGQAATVTSLAIRVHHLWHAKGGNDANGHYAGSVYNYGKTGPTPIATDASPALRSTRATAPRRSSTAAANSLAAREARSIGRSISRS